MTSAALNKLFSSIQIAEIAYSGGQDPFTRKPLKLEDLKPDPELKKRVEIWLKQKKTGVVTDEEKKKGEQPVLPLKKNKSVPNKAKEEEAFLSTHLMAPQPDAEDQELAKAIELSLKLSRPEGK